jgi:hypothetical protein
VQPVWQPTGAANGESLAVPCPPCTPDVASSTRCRRLSLRACPAARLKCSAALAASPARRQASPSLRFNSASPSPAATSSSASSSLSSGATPASSRSAPIFTASAQRFCSSARRICVRDLPLPNKFRQKLIDQSFLQNTIVHPTKPVDRRILLSEPARCPDTYQMQKPDRRRRSNRRSGWT